MRPADSRSLVILLLLNMSFRMNRAQSKLKKVNQLFINAKILSRTVYNVIYWSISCTNLIYIQNYFSRNHLRSPLSAGIHNITHDGASFVPTPGPSVPHLSPQRPPPAALAKGPPSLQSPPTTAGPTHQNLHHSRGHLCPLFHSARHLLVPHLLLGDFPLSFGVVLTFPRCCGRHGISDGRSELSYQLSCLSLFSRWFSASFTALPLETEEARTPAFQYNLSGAQDHDSARGREMKGRGEECGRARVAGSMTERARGIAGRGSKKARRNRGRRLKNSGI